MGGPLKKYEVTLPGGRVTTMKLNEQDAERYGAIQGGQDAEASAEQETKPEETPAKTRSVRNKARAAAADKDGGTGGGD